MSRRRLPCAAPAQLLLLVLVHLASSLGPAASASDTQCYDAIFSFGDSFADTGNKPIAFSWYSVPVTVMRPPYGETFFGHPTGRTTDGRVILDIVAQALGVPLVPASLASHNASVFSRGANFAVAGATTLDAGFYHARGIPGGASKLPINTSLNVQLEWFEALAPSLCATSSRGCKEFFGRSLFFVGEFGVNDYHLSLNKLSVQQVRSLIPAVIETISTAIEKLIAKHGATSLVVPGVIPSGCSPPVFAMFPDAAPAEYDSRTGCLKAQNELGRHHNALLQASLKKLRAKHPHARILYADFFGPVMEMVESPRKFGFTDDVLTVCCGGPGRNNYNGSIYCGDPGATTCGDPSASLYWDGVHFTEAANRYIAAGWLSSVNGY